MGLNSEYNWPQLGRVSAFIREKELGGAFFVTRLLPFCFKDGHKKKDYASIKFFCVADINFTAFTVQA